MYIKKIFTAAIAAILLNGCIILKERNLPQIADNQIKVTTFSKVKVYTKWDFVTEQAGVNPIMLGYKKNLEDEISNTGCCVIVDRSRNADLIIEAKAYDEHNYMGGAIAAGIAGGSLLTIPGWTTGKIHVTAEAKINNKLRSYDLHDSMTIVFWLPFILALPFGDNANIEKARHNLDLNTLRNLVLKMKEDGLLEVSSGVKNQK